MAISPSKYKDIQFFSNFSHNREIAKGVVASTGSWAEVNTTRSIPATVTELPPYVRAYVEYPSGVFSPVQGGDGIQVGWNDTTIYFNGSYNDAVGDPFSIHYFVYDRNQKL